ncbi:MAG: DUF438 domain-containing protein [Spirochaetaceae bacterium]|nr:DUF438 domain-containing protein [Spirochaetaceae bacterium]
MIKNHNDKQKQLKSIVMDLHEGKTPKEVKKRFDKLIRNVSPEEIADMEQGLIAEGMPVEQVQGLCDVHVSVFKSAIEVAPKGKVLPGHPIHSYREENKAAGKFARILLRESRHTNRKGNRFSAAMEDMEALEIHFRRKENQLFPYLEAVNFTGPSKVMWGKHDEIREAFKEVRKAHTSGVNKVLRRKVRALTGAVKRMIFMEERILFPTALRKLSDKAWVEIRRGEAEIGYAWITPGNLWDANVVQAESSRESVAAPKPVVSSDNPGIPLETGELLPAQINMMLKALPFDLTYVDSNDKVCYYSQGKERLFPRSPGIIGRDVSNCHPPKSVHIVEKIVQSFRNKEKDVAEFWFTMNEKFIHIRYFPVYSELGLYKGTIEVSQDVTDIRALEGVRKLLDWD